MIRYQSIGIILTMLTTLKGKGIPFLIQFTNKANEAQKIVSLNSCKLLSQQMLRQKIFTKPACNKIFIKLDGFSTYFDELDKKDVQSYTERKFQNKKFRGLIDLWKKPL